MSLYDAVQAAAQTFYKAYGVLPSSARLHRDDLIRIQDNVHFLLRSYAPVEGWVGNVLVHADPYGELQRGTVAMYNPRLEMREPYLVLLDDPKLPTIYDRLQGEDPL